MKMLYSRELLRNVSVSSDDTTTITKYTYDTAMLPMGDPVFIG
jgi:hypothetical protein